MGKDYHMVNTGGNDYKLMDDDEYKKYNKMGWGCGTSIVVFILIVLLFTCKGGNKTSTETNTVEPNNTSQESTHSTHKRNKNNTITIKDANQDIQSDEVSEDISSNGNEISNTEGTTDICPEGIEE